MPSRHDPVVCLAEMIENIERIDHYIAGMDRDRFAGDDLVRDAVERCLERVCEAAFRLGQRAPRLMPDQPWGSIRGTGNRLRHAYDRIGLDVIWNTVRHDLPTLAADARRALRELRAERGDGG